MKNIENSMTLKFESKSVNEGFARQAVAAFVSQLDPTIDELQDIKTVVSEAVTNSIIHGYKNNRGYIIIDVKLMQYNTVEITVKDKGCGIPNIEVARQPMYTTGNNERSGMGFTIMESFTDKIRIRSTEDSGTTVTMVKRLSPRVSGGNFCAE